MTYMYDNLNPEEKMEMLEKLNPEMHRILSSLIKARGDKKDGIPNGFSYVRALQDYDKERGLQFDKGLYTFIINHYDGLVENYREQIE